MKTKHYLFLLLNVILFGFGYSQNQNASDTGFFNYAHWHGVADKMKLNKADRAEMIEGQKQIYLEELNHKHVDSKDLVWVYEPSDSKYSNNGVSAGPCTNIDFENGNFTGWTRSTGFNPLVNNAGCCGTVNGDQTIVTGAGLDPFGGFPVVYPGGGNFSLRLGSTTVGGRADRIQQTFFVTPANANFTYRYAVVLNDPGHTLVQQPYFTSEIIDTLGNQINCTVYSVTAAGNIPGFVTSNVNSPSGGAVRYKTWTDVAIDLTPNIGQNVTIRFTVYDCSLTGHFAYAYIDGLCTSFQTASADTTCPNVPIPLCAPAGFASTSWNGPGVVNDPNQCILVSTPGIYSCNTLLGPGCPGPTFTHTLVNQPTANLSFTAVSGGSCSSQYTFVNGSSIATPHTLLNYQWFFGDGTTLTTGSTASPTHNYTQPGNYTVKLKTLSSLGCFDSIVRSITVFPVPNISFTPPSNCINTVTQFSNTSTIAFGSITSYTWDFQGNAPNTNVVNPAVTYTNSGTFSITLSAISDQGCTASLTQTLGIFPPPIISFSASNLCDVVGTSFAPSTSTAITSGSLTTFLWDFGDGSTSTLANPVHVYTTTGTYTVSFTAISNHNCSSTITNSFSILPSPLVSFATTSVNACSPNFTFTNNSSIPSGSATYTWSFGGTNTTIALNPTVSFPGIGDYTVQLIGESDLGCLDTMFQFISVYPYPTINVNIPASCESAIFTATTAAVSGSVTSYLWDFGDPLSGASNTSTLQNPTHFYSATGIYTVNLSIISNLDCPSSIATTMTVFPNPVAVFTSSTQNSCSLPYTFTNSSTVANIGASTITNYLWSVDGVSVSTQTNPGTYNFPSHGDYTVTLIATTNHNCSDTMISNILVHPLPDLSFTVNPTCLNVSTNINSTATISPIPSPLASISSYTWNYGDNTSSNAPASPPHTYLTPGIYAISFGATSNLGCTASLSKTVQIHPIAAIDFTATNLCFGDTAKFSSTSTIPGTPPGTVTSQNWSFGNGGTGSNQNTSNYYTAPGNYPVTFSVTTNNECLTTLTKIITVNPLPVASFTVNNACLNTPSQFVGTSSISLGSISSYSWNYGDGNGSAAQNPPAHIYTSFGTYFPSFIVTSGQNCSVSVTNSVIVHPLPSISFNPPSACVNTPIQFNNTSSIPLGSITSYVWNFADGTPTISAINPQHTYATEANYAVTLTAVSDQNCVNTSVNTLSIFPFPSGVIVPLNSACVNGQVIINPNITITGANNPVPNYTVSFGDGSPSVTYSTSLPPTISHSYSVHNTYTVSITANSTNNCARTFTTQALVYPLPFPAFTASNVCFKDQTQFVNSSTIAPTAPSSPTQYSITGYIWQFGGGAGSTVTATNPSYQFPGPSVYGVTLTALSQPETTLSCNQSVVQSVTINPLPPLVSFSSNSVCLGNPTQFTNTTPTLGVTGWSWFHSTPGLLTSISRNPSFTYSSAGIHTATLVALNNFGCRDTIRDTIRVYANPTASFVTNNVCQNELSAFTNASIPNEGSLSTYTWVTNGSPGFTNPNATNGTIVFNASGIYSVELTASTNLGCRGKYTSTVEVYPLPSINFGASESCFKNPTQFSNLTNISSGNITGFLWNFGDPASGGNNTSAIQNPAHVYSGSGTYTATLTVSSDRNCSAAGTQTIIVRNIPFASFSSSVICAGDKHSFTNLSSSPEGTITNNQWDFNGDNVIDQDLVTPDYTYPSTGNYNTRLVVTTQYGCSDDTTIQLLVNPKAVGSISVNARSGCPNLTVKFTNQSSIISGTYTSSWDFGDNGPTNNFENPSNTFGAGDYDITLTLTSDLGCKTIFRQPAYIRVFPNPTAGFRVEPEEIDEEEPVISVSSLASSDVSNTRYFITDGSSFGTPDFIHYIKNLKQTKPMVVQVVRNQFGCSDTISQVLNIKPAHVIYFPNVFTPNGDGTNDTFMPKGVGIQAFTMQIYDRWGHVVFRTDDITELWDGTSLRTGEPIKEDVYTWKATVTDIFNQNHFLVGHVTLIR